MIVIPVKINGAGPFNFLVDTGTSRTILEQKLAADLSLQTVPKTNIKLTGISGTSTVSLVRVDALSVAGQTVHGMCLSAGKSLPEGMHGILGEDFLSGFDVLIDYRQHTLELSADPLFLAASLKGEHLPLSSHGVFAGTPTANRIVLQGHANEFGDRTHSFLLDSGTNAFVLFASSTNGLNSISLKEDSASGVQQTMGRLSVSRTKIHFLFLEGRILSNVFAVLVNGHDPVDVDGVIPTAWFGSLFLCHTGGYVIFNPTRGSTTAPESGRQILAANAASLDSR